MVIEMTQAAVEDERRHTEICDTLAAEFGWKGPASESTPEPPPLGPSDLSQRDRVLFEMMAFCGFTETLNAAMLTQILKTVKVPKIRDAVHAIAHDEVAHSRAGWAHLHDQCTQGRGAFLAELLPHMMETARVTEIFGRDPSRDGPRMAAFGELDDARRTEIFRGVVRDVFFPGLEGLGISTDPGRRWLEQRQIQL